MNAAELKDRTRRFGIAVARYVESPGATAFLLNTRSQVIRSATSVGANYHEACRARSRKEFISKLAIVVQELDETAYWLKLLKEYRGRDDETLDLLLKETDELTAIMTASSRTAQRFYKRTS